MNVETYLYETQCAVANARYHLIVFIIRPWYVDMVHSFDDILLNYYVYNGREGDYLN